MTKYEGSCHCGAVTYEVEIDNAKHVLCHCNACKKTSGSDFTLNTIVSSDSLKFTKGEDQLKKYTYKGDSGNDTDCFFCTTCGSVPYKIQHIMGPGKVVIRGSLLKDSDEWGKPAAEVYGKDKAEWQPQVGGAIFETVPPS